ncbi:transposase [Sphingobium amiense]|uniref:transposase n=1 Tax=Sphingobium amiense TaxID=135719 RepID=UPI0038CD814E
MENGRRRRWTLEEKRAVVELSLDPACSMAEVAACFDVLPAQIYAWRRELRVSVIPDPRGGNVPVKRLKRGRCARRSWGSARA